MPHLDGSSHRTRGTILSVHTGVHHVEAERFHPLVLESLVIRLAFRSRDYFEIWNQKIMMTEKYLRRHILMTMLLELEWKLKPELIGISETRRMKYYNNTNTFIVCLESNGMLVNNLYSIIVLPTSNLM